MNINKIEDKRLLRKRDIIIYVVCILVCILAVVIVVTVQFMGKDMSDKIFGITKAETISQEEHEKLVNEFENMFKNDFAGDSKNIEKVEEDKKLVYTDFNRKENEVGLYNVDINIPKINIKDEKIKELNSKISKEIIDRFKEVFKNKNNIIFTVEYNSFLDNDIVTVVVRINIKQGNNPQQVVINTYNWDVINKKEVAFDEIVTKMNYDKKEVNDIIVKEIKKEEENSKVYKESGYNIYVRNAEDEMYKYENINNFYIFNNKLYILFPYGNKSYTTTIDIVII